MKRIYKEGGMMKVWNSLTDEAQDALLIAGFFVAYGFLFLVMTA